MSSTFDLSDVTCKQLLGTVSRPFYAVRETETFTVRVNEALAYKLLNTSITVNITL